MTIQDIAAVCTALGLGSFIPKLWRMINGESAAKSGLLKEETRKVKAESDSLIIERLYAEIERLDRERENQDRKIDAQNDKIADLKRLDDERNEREADLKRENAQLIVKVKKLENRIAGLEKVFQIGPVPPVMQAALDKLKDIE